MVDLESLRTRIAAEVAAGERRIKAMQAEAVQTYEGRQSRLKTFEKVCEQLRDVWRPRLELLAKQFGDDVKIKPSVSREMRQAVLDFGTKIATVQLRFAASTDTDARKLILDYNLDILPILMAFERHSRLELPLESVDAETVAKWIDDRILDFVRTYLSLSQNEYYLKDHMVEDPVAGVRFPKFAAAAKLERGNQTLYFISAKTCGEYTERETASGKGSQA